MALPGFKAEASLYRTSGRYRLVSARTRAQGGLHPAQSNGSTSYCLPDPSVANCYNCTETDAYGNILSTWQEGDGCAPKCDHWQFCNYDAQGCQTCTWMNDDCTTGSSTECPPVFVTE
jgi:hypothetical protein